MLFCCLLWGLSNNSPLNLDNIESNICKHNLLRFEYFLEIVEESKIGFKIDEYCENMIYDICKDEAALTSRVSNINNSKCSPMLKRKMIALNEAAYKRAKEGITLINNIKKVDKLFDESNNKCLDNAIGNYGIHEDYYLLLQLMNGYHQARKSSKWLSIAEFHALVEEQEREIDERNRQLREERRKRRRRGFSANNNNNNNRNNSNNNSNNNNNHNNNYDRRNNRHDNYDSYNFVDNVGNDDTVVHDNRRYLQDMGNMGYVDNMNRRLLNNSRQKYNRDKNRNRNGANQVANGSRNKLSRNTNSKKNKNKNKDKDKEKDKDKNDKNSKNTAICTVCFDKKVNMSATCGHAYCKECIANIYDAETGSKSILIIDNFGTFKIRCPQCRVRHTFRPLYL